MLVKAVRDANLHTVVPYHDFLQRAARRYELREEGDAVVFSGVRGDRYRMVVRLGGGPVLALPPTDFGWRRLRRHYDTSRRWMNFTEDSTSTSRLAGLATLALQQMERARLRAAAHAQVP